MKFVPGENGINPEKTYPDFYLPRNPYGVTGTLTLNHRDGVVPGFFRFFFFVIAYQALHL